MPEPATRNPTVNRLLVGALGKWGRILVAREDGSPMYGNAMSVGMLVFYLVRVLVWPDFCEFLVYKIKKTRHPNPGHFRLSV